MDSGEAVRRVVVLGRGLTGERVCPRCRDQILRTEVRVGVLWYVCPSRMCGYAEPAT